MLSTVLNRRPVNLSFARLSLDGELRGRKDVYWFRQNIPTPIHSSLRYQLCIRFAVGVTNDRERDECPRSLVCV
jgi:hypothetical protein